MHHLFKGHYRSILNIESIAFSKTILHFVLQFLSITLLAKNFSFTPPNTTDANFHPANDSN